MIYAYDITTPKVGESGNPKRTTLKVTKGLVYQVEIEFPPGPLGLLHVAIFDGGYQVWPSNPDFDFHGDNGMIVFPDTYLKLTEPYEFWALTTNEDDTYQHQIHIRIGMASSEVFMSRYLPSISYEKMLEVLQRAQESQAEERMAVIAKPLPWKD
ncbi:MAG: hypothetical protein ACXAEN_22795 [Candidatus Thorarchaeota archaeon]|jgi:hypothetical protein